MGKALRHHIYYTREHKQELRQLIPQDVRFMVRYENHQEILYILNSVHKYIRWGEVKTMIEYLKQINKKEEN